jgi:DEAD/DEAH box helicase domain-containing protein
MLPHFQFDAYGAFRHLQQRYVDFLLDTLRVRPGPLAERLRTHWQSSGPDPFALFRPLLVEGAFPFKPGEKVHALTSSPKARDPLRPLHPKTVARIEHGGFATSLYDHQVEAVRAGGEGKTVVLSAGTGSGKTEAFLIPLLDQLYWAHEQGKDDLSQPGVRAIIVYPLNALVNNQVERLLRLLAGQEEITFGYYTGRLRNYFTDAKRSYESRKAPVPPPCQIIDRRTLRGIDKPAGRPIGPPHILVTNFSMLEYMLIRPLDRTIFLPQQLWNHGVPRLRSIVLDEAHVYAGAQADEIHMLLRRTAQRFGTSLADVQGYATSATLSQGAGVEQEREALRRFAERMFEKPGDRIAAIVGHRFLPPEAGRPRGDAPSLRVLPDAGRLIPENLRTLEFDNDGAPRAFVRDAVLARAVADACVALGVALPRDVDGLDPKIGEVPALLLHALFSSHPRVIELRKWLFERERTSLPTLDELAAFAFQKQEVGPLEAAAADVLLRLGSLARREPSAHPFIPARMHAFLRAPAGVWIASRGAVYNGKSDDLEWADLFSSGPSGTPGESPRLAVFLCERCGGIHLEAWEKDDGWGGAEVVAIRPAGPSAAIALVFDKDADIRVFGDNGPRMRKAALAQSEVRRRDVLATIEQATLKECSYCGDERATLFPLRINPRSALGAIVDAIYPSLGEHASSLETVLPGRGRRLLTFSDSRQQAARAAAEVEQSHDTGVNRQVLYRALAQDELKVKDLVERIDEESTDLNERAAARGLNDGFRRDLAEIAVHEELALPPANGNTLETMGLVEVVYPGLPARPVEVTGLSDEEWTDFLATVLDDVRRRGAVRKPAPEAREGSEELNLDELLPLGLGKLLVWTTEAPEEGDEEEFRRSSTVGFIPQRAAHPSRMLAFAGRLVGEDRAMDLLRKVWDVLWAIANDRRVKWLQVVSAPPHAQAIRIDFREVVLRRHEAPAFFEPTSRRYYFRSVRDVPPERGARGELRALTEDDRRTWLASHGIVRVLEEPLLGLYADEHTAQINVDDLETEEKNFRNGRTNLLASSTTMEMGIDLGGLTFVLLTNVPPGPASYWQRAGRAGRRADGSSLVLTLALPLPHDQKVFRDPRAFLAQSVVPPRVRLDARPLLLRHVNAVLLAAFFEEALASSEKGNPMRAFGTMGELVFTSAQKDGAMKPDVHEALGLAAEDPISEAFLRWLDALSEESATALRFLMLVRGTALSTWTLREATSVCGRMFERAVVRVRQDWQSIQAQRDEQQKKGAGDTDTRYLAALDYQEKALLRETVIGYLARMDFLPRFGFPVGVVKLETKWKFNKRSTHDTQDGWEAGKQGDREEASCMLPDLRMERALDFALSEYVPGGQVIAGKRVHTSAGLIRNWMNDDDQGRAKRRFVLECVRCGAVEDHATEPRECSVCKTKVQSEEAFLEHEKAAEAQAARDATKGAATDGAPEMSAVRSYWIPSSFAVRVGIRPERVAGKVTRMPHARARLALSSDDAVREVIPGLLAVGFAPESRLFVRSEGRLRRGGLGGFGYAICRACGRAEPETGFGRIPDALVHKSGSHTRLRGGGACPGKAQMVSRHAILGTSTTVDALRVRLLGDLAPAGVTDEEAFFMTLAICLQQVAADTLGVDRRVIKPTIGTYRDRTEKGYGREAVLYDETCSGMLAHLAEDSTSLVRAAIDLAIHAADTDFIQFDTQFLAMEGKLRIDLVRAFFLEPGRAQAIREPEALASFHARPLRGAGPITAARQLLQDASDLLFIAPELSPDAFHKDGVLRAAQVALPAGTRSPLRFLLGHLPSPSGGSDDAVLAAKLAGLVRDGVLVRTCPIPADLPWRVVADVYGSVRAIGGVVSKAKKLGPDVRPALGPDWLHDSLAIEPREHGQAIREQVQRLWDAAKTVDVTRFEPAPRSNVCYVPIGQGATDAASTNLRVILENELGPIGSLGEVVQIAYVDRYVRRSPVAMVELASLLDLFTYHKGARGLVQSEGGSKDATTTRTVDDIFRDSWPGKNLSEHEAASFGMWLQTSFKGRLKIEYRGADSMPRSFLRHPRKLLVKFGAGGKMRVLKVAFEHGLDWARPSGGRCSWRQQGRRADETHIVIVRDYDLSLERDDAGHSEWHAYFDK